MPMRPTLNHQSPAGGHGCQKCAAPVRDGADLLDAVRRAGHPITGPRAAVVRTVAAQSRPFTAAQLCEAVASLDSTIGKATVFRTLALLEETGLLHRLHALHRGASYLARDPARPGAAHQYLVCTACDGATPVEAPELPALLRSLAARQAFRAEDGLVEIVGRCQSC
jgi:Fe2+ or Zn2+ uptake regulation protein